MELYSENNLEYRKNFKKNKWLKLIHRKHNIEPNDKNYPLLHPNNFFELKTIYGNHYFEITTVISSFKEYLDEKTLTKINKLLNLWEKIKPSIESNFYDKWFHEVFLYCSIKYSPRYYTFEQKIKYTCERISKYHPDFDYEKHKHLIVRYLMTY